MPEGPLNQGTFNFELHAVGIEVERRSSIEVPADRALQNRGTEPFLVRCRHRRAAMLGPSKSQGFAMTAPVYADPTGVVRQGPIFRRVRRKLMERQGQAQYLLRLEAERRTRNLDAIPIGQMWRQTL